METMGDTIRRLTKVVKALSSGLRRGGKRFLQVLRSSSLINGVSSRKVLCNLPRTRRHLGFLLGRGHPLQAFSRRFGQRVERTSLASSLRSLLRTLRQRGLSMVIISRAAPRVGQDKLRYIGILVPNVLSVAFKRRLAQMAKLREILRIPVGLKCTGRPLAIRRLGPRPRPFPWT